jgi:hypothetical protein
MQNLYVGSQFPAQPMIIRELRFRPSAVHGQAFSTVISNLQINMSVTSKIPFPTFGFTFANNTGTNDTVVFQGQVAISSAFSGPVNGPKAFDIVIPLTTPYLYDPSRGNLLIDYRNFSGSSAALIDVGPSSSLAARAFGPIPLQ